MSGTRTQRIIAIILLISPWLYIPSVFKEIGFIILATLLYLSTVDVRKKKEVPARDLSTPSVIPPLA